MLLASLNTAAVTTVALVPTAANVATTALKSANTTMVILDRGLNVADAHAANWEKTSLDALKLSADQEGKAAITAASLKAAQSDEALEQALSASPTLRARFDEHHARLSSL